MCVTEAWKDWRGAYVPLVTPYDPHLQIDPEGLRTNVRFLLEQGARTGNTVLLVCGAGGDFPMLTLEERKALARIAVEEVRGRVPVIVGAQHTGIRGVAEIISHAESIGADAVQVSFPYYFPPSEDDMIEFYEEVSCECPLPIMAYNTYWEYHDSSPHMTVKVLEALSALENVLFLKWSAPSVAEYVEGIILFRDRFAIINNQGLHTYSHMLGVDGFVTHLAAVWPEHEWRLWQLMEAGRYPEAEELVQKVNMRWLDYRARVSSRTCGEAVAVKKALDLVGLAGGPSRGPSRDHAITEEDVALLRDVLSNREPARPLGER